MSLDSHDGHGRRPSPTTPAEPLSPAMTKAELLTLMHRHGGGCDLMTALFAGYLASRLEER